MESVDQRRKATRISQYKKEREREKQNKTKKAFDELQQFMIKTFHKQE